MQGSQPHNDFLAPGALSVRRNPRGGLRLQRDNFKLHPGSKQLLTRPGNTRPLRRDKTGMRMFVEVSKETNAGGARVVKRTQLQSA